MVVPRENAIDEIETAVTPLVLTGKVNEVISWINAAMTSLYPVGSVYITTDDTCPLATLIPNSTWTLVSQDQVLQGSSQNHAAGTSISAGLPNITGSADGICGQNSTGSTKGTGAFSGAVVVANASIRGSGAGSLANFPFDASLSNNIYGASNTVQPPAYVVNIFKRTA